MNSFILLFLLLSSSFIGIQGGEKEDFPISVEGWLSTSSNCSSPINTILRKQSPSVSLRNTANKNCEQSFSFNFAPNILKEKPEMAFRITFQIEREKADNNNCPILFAIFEEEQIATVKLPYIERNSNSNNTMSYFTGKTLCKSSSKDNGTDIVIVRASTCSSENIPFTIYAEVFNASLRRFSEEKLAIRVGPTAPQQLVYTFGDETSVKVETTSQSDVCMTVSIQSLYCPIFDQEDNVKYTGHYKTMTKQSVMEIEKADFQEGFTIAFIVHNDDSECLSKTNTTFSKSKEKVVFVRLISPESQNAFISFLGLIIPLAISTLVVIAIYAGYTYHDRYLQKRLQSLSLHNTRRNSRDTDKPRSSVFLSDFNTASSRLNGYVPVPPEIPFPEANGLHNTNRHSRHFVGILLLISVFYAIPVYELAINFLVTLGGNYDRCFFNEECVYRLGGIADFNNFWSNASYFFFGILFWSISHSRGHSEPFRNAHATKGIHFQKEMFYSFGVALAMEGVFSAAYHLCPNRFTFQYDTTFMYVIASLIMIQLFLSRHPVAYFTAYKIYWILVFLVLITALSYLLDTAEDYNTLKYVYTLYPIGQSLFIMGITIYYCDVGLIKDDSGNLVISPFEIVKKRVGSVCKKYNGVHPFLFKRAVVPILILITSIVIFCVLISKNTGFASILLLTVVTITLICIASYIFWKALYGELGGKKRSLFYFPALCFLASGLIGVVALSFFFTTPYDPDDSPAISRSKNTLCYLSIYDNHDWWHMISAISLFLGFMGLLTIDDGLIGTPHEEIHVF